VPKPSSRQRWLLPLILLALVVPIAMFTPRLPGDPQLARAIQGLGIPSSPAAWITSFAVRPVVYGVMGVGLVLATWRGRLRGFVAAALLIGLWWYIGEPIKEIVKRPRPTAAFVDVVRPSSGYSFPSTFATTWFSAWLPVAIYSWRSRQRSAGLAVAIGAWLLVVAGAWARIRMGAHWPSDLLMTFAMVWATFSLLEIAVDRLDTTP
jgi:membrane-associated phospholipid phosphatase